MQEGVSSFPRMMNADHFFVRFKFPSGVIQNSIPSLPYRITVEMDDDVVKHYCNEDTFQMSVLKDQDDDSLMVTLCEM